MTGDTLSTVPLNWCVAGIGDTNGHAFRNLVAQR